MSDQLAKCQQTPRYGRRGRGEDMNNETITPAKLAEWKAACEVIPNEEWVIATDSRGYLSIDPIDVYIDHGSAAITDVDRAVATFICHAHNAMPRLIERVESLEEENDAYAELLAKEVSIDRTRQMAQLRKEVSTARRVIGRIEDWKQLIVEMQNIPDGYRPLTAYTDGTEIVVLGDPPDDNDDGTLHDCDEMGCSSVSHVLARMTLPTKQEPADA